MPPSRRPDSAPSGSQPSDAALSDLPAPAPADCIEYLVRPRNGEWLIEHAGNSYGPYKDCREATFFAIDAARQLGARGKNTRVKAVDHAGHLLTTWSYGVDPYPAVLSLSGPASPH